MDGSADAEGAAAARTTASLRSGLAKGRRPRAPLASVVAVLAGLVGALVVALVLLAGRAQATGTLSADVTGPGTTASGTTLVDVATMTCSQVASALQGDAGSNTAVSLPIGPTGFASLDASRLALATEPIGGSGGCTTLTLQGASGATSVLGQSAGLLVVGSWSSATATSPTFSVVVGFQNVGLSSLVSAGAPGPAVQLSSALLAFTTSSSGTTLDTAALPASAGSFLGSNLSVAGSGLSLRGVLATTGAVATGVSDLGVSPSGITLQGSLTGSASFSLSSAPSVTAGLDLSASFTPTLQTPSWLSLGSLTLSIQGGSGTWTASASGSAEVTLPRSGQVPVTADLSITDAAGGVTVALDASLGTVTAPFGQSWLTLDQTTVSWSIGATTAASLDATATLDGSSFTVAASLGSGTGLSVELTTTATLDAATLAGDLGLPAFPSGTPDLQLSGLDLALEIPGTGSVTVAVEGTATVPLGSGSFSADVLVRAQLGSGGSLLVAARPTTTLTLSQLLGTTVNPDFTLPSLALVVSTANLSIPSSQLDAPTLAYFQPVLCSSSDPTCSFTLNASAGVGLSASTPLPSAIKTGLCGLLKLSVSACANLLTGPVVIDGQIPLFGGTTTSLTVHLPTITLAAGPIQQLKLHFSISETGSKVSVGAGGDIELFAPGTGGNSTCPQSLQGSLPQGDVCLDVSVTGSIGASGGNASVTLTGQLTGGNATSGWTLPSPASFVTINDLALQIGVSSAGGGSLTLGAHGAVTIGSSDLGVSVDLAVTASPPFVDLLGFQIASHQGVTMADLVDLYNEVSGGNVSTSSLPPLALRNIYLSYSSVDSTALCLQQGIYLSGDLVLANSGATAVGGTAPTGQASDCSPPSRSSVCSSDSSSCLASVFLSISPSGILGEGHLAGWSAGPLSFQPTNLSFTLDSSEVQVDISGGGQLLDPVLYKTEGSAAPVWGSGTLTLDVGTQKLHLAGSIDVGGLSGSVNATGSLDLSNPGFNLTDWFNTVKQAFQTAGAHIKGAIDTATTATSAWYQTYVAGSANQVVGDIRSGFQFLGSSGPPTWQKVLSVYQSVAGKIDGVNSGLNKAGLGRLDIPTTSIFQDALDGLNFPGWRPCGFLGCVTIVPGFTIPGLCSNTPSGPVDPAIFGTPLCTQPFSEVVASARHLFADPSVNTTLGSAGLAVPNGARPGQLVRRIHAVDPAAPTSITCAMTTVSYTQGTQSPTSIEVSSLGHSVTFTGPSPTSLGSVLTSTTNHSLSQGTLDGLYSGTNTGACTAPPTPAPSISLSLNRTWVDEGGTVTASGYVENSSATTVQLAWGDGTTSTATVSNSQYQASHTYADETAGGATSSFAVTASVPGVTPATGQVSVLDTPLAVASLTVSPQTANLMTPVTLRGALAAPEPGETETATITWGDATAPSTVTVGPGGTFSATHTYEVLAPSGSPTAVEPVAVSVAEADGTSASAGTSVTVDDVAPKGTTLTPTAGATVVQSVGGGQIGTAGTVFTHAGTPVTWMATALHISPEAVLTFQTSWADGTTPTTLTATTPSGPVDPATGWFPYSASATGFPHTFPAACLDLVTTSVTDADTLAAPVLTTPVVVTAPLGAPPEGSGYWLGQLRLVQWLAAHPSAGAASGRDHHLQLTAAQLTCDLRIASYLSPPLAQALASPSGPSGSLAAAERLLAPGDPTGGLQGRLASDVKLHLLTTLLDFANGTGDWSRYSAVVASAEQALASGSPRGLFEAIKALDEATFGDPGNH